MLRNKSLAPRGESRILRNALKALRSESSVLRKKSQILRNESQALTRESQIVRSESQTLRSESWILRNRWQILRNESEALRCHHHRVYTEEFNKIALNSNNDKKIQTFDRITTYPYGTNAFKVCENETRYVRLKNKSQAPGNESQILRNKS